VAFPQAGVAGHNAADKDLARLLAEAFDLLEVDAWFDEWKIRPGDSIAGGIEEGLSTADVFLLLWSEASAGSNWVGAEVNAYLHRRVADETLRIVPVILDETLFRRWSPTTGASLWIP
jgi:TIR domain